MVKTLNKTKQKNIFLRMLPVQRFIISVVLASVIYILLLVTDLNVIMKIMIAWSGFALSYISTSCIVFFTQTSTEIRKYSRQEDGSRIYVFLLIVITSFASLFTVLLLMASQTKDTPQMILIPLAISGMLLSWLMVHVIFAFHYAHLYYGDDVNNPSKHAEGLKFPDEKRPDYVDFLYFSFVIGTTFQVSDTDVTSRSIRRLVLLHGLLSFGLNAFVIALTINLIAGLMK